MSNVYFPERLKSTPVLDLVVDNSQNYFILAGDYKSHHTASGHRSDVTRFFLCGWVCEKKVCIENSGSAAFFRGSATSILDLTLRSRLVCG